MRISDWSSDVCSSDLSSGDLGRVGADQFVWIDGRAKDVIIRGGHNIDPALIEEALVRRPDILLAAAVGLPDREKGELPQIGRAHVCTTVTNAHLVCRLLLDHKQNPRIIHTIITIIPYRLSTSLLLFTNNH